MSQHKRRQKLILPKLQLRLTLIFVGLAALSSLLQFMLFASELLALSLRLPTDGVVLSEAAGGVLSKILLISFAVFLPLIFVVGILTTFRIAGPIYRMQEHLKEINQGGSPLDCKLRKQDQLHEFCDLLNEATRPVRMSNAAAQEVQAQASQDVSDEAPGPLPASESTPSTEVS